MVEVKDGKKILTTPISAEDKVCARIIFELKLILIKSNE